MIEVSRIFVAGLRKRVPEDQESVAALLHRCDLPADGLGQTEGWVVEGPEGIQGHAALERVPGAVVLRSLAVDPARRGEGLGRVLFDLAEAHAGSDLRVLRTDTIAPWVLRRGYRELRLGDLPEAIRSTTQFSGGLCASAPIFVKEG
jgi:N-acetylglutamate synthase-like GNAT family acetyltransferase